MIMSNHTVITIYNSLVCTYINTIQDSNILRQKQTMYDMKNRIDQYISKYPKYSYHIIRKFVCYFIRLFDGGVDPPHIESFESFLLASSSRSKNSSR